MIDMSEQVETYSKAKVILMKRGVKAYVAISGSPVHVQVVKADLLRLIERRERYGSTGPTDYDGQPTCFYYYPEDGLLYIDGGI